MLIYILLLATNIILIMCINANRKYWLAGISLFTLLLGGFITWLIISNHNLKRYEQTYEQSTTTSSYGNHDAWITLSKMRKEAKQTNGVLINLLVLQSLVTFILQLIGLKKTRAKVYYKTSWICGILFLVMLWLRIMMGLFPGGAMVM